LLLLGCCSTSTTNRHLLLLLLLLLLLVLLQAPICFLQELLKLQSVTADEGSEPASAGPDICAPILRQLQPGRRLLLQKLL
jgi:hypothetical protein